MRPSTRTCTASGRIADRQPLVVRDGEHSHTPFADGFVDAPSDVVQAVDVDSRVELVQHRDPGSNTPSCRTSLRFLSPPDRSTLTARSKKTGSSPTLSASVALRPSSNLRAALFGHRMVADGSPRSRTSMRATPGTSVGYCGARNSPSLARCQAGKVEQLGAVERDAPAEHLVAWAAHDHVSEGALAGTVRPHDGVHLSGSHRQVDTA